MVTLFERYEVLEAGDVPGALKQLSENSDIGLVILDYHLPLMHPKKLEVHLKYKNMPYVYYTAETDHSEISTKAVILNKGPHMQDLLDAVDTWIKKGQKG